MRFGFSAASPVSRHEAYDLLPLQRVQIPKEKVKGLHPADSEVALKEPHVDTLMYIY